uniref:C2 domain-containing protein n=1 Tax=Zooxanthella nutricula TaxID=1333877 RepID=A0A7S2P381_9DINO
MGEWTAKLDCWCCKGTGNEIQIQNELLVPEPLLTADTPGHATGKKSCAHFGPVDAVDAPKHNFIVEIHSAHLNRSFARIGWMDPYAILYADEAEVERTKTALFAHKSPKWEVSHTFQSGEIPHVITVHVWDKNSLHKDVFCGSVTVPCAEDMGEIEHQDFVLTKKGNATGVVTLSIKVPEVEEKEGAELEDCAPVFSSARSEASLSPKRSAKSIASMKSQRSLAGGELDHIMAALVPERQRSNEFNRSRKSIVMREVKHPRVSKADMEDSKSLHGEEDWHEVSHDAEAATPSSALRKSVAVRKSVTPQLAADVCGPLIGAWKCTETHGLEAFLKSTGVGMFQRKIALAAAWPGWEFATNGEKLEFVNHSAIGNLVEHIDMRKEYTHKDGHQNEFACKATWLPTDSGRTLRITRTGKMGSYVEEREVVDDTLTFNLTNDQKVTWGRTFQRMEH